MSRIKRAGQCFPERFTEAWLSCLLVMVQGDVLALTLKHSIVAAKTGLLAAIGSAFCVLVIGRPTQTQNAIAIGAFTAIADYIVHPTHFGPHWAEAVVTGVGASVLALLVDYIRKRKGA